MRVIKDILTRLDACNNDRVLKCQPTTQDTPYKYLTHLREHYATRAYFTYLAQNI